MTDEKLNDLFDRLRETEAQTREQQVRIETLTDKIDAQNERLSSFSTVVDKFTSQLQQREERSENREKNFWKIIYIMLGTIVSMALGPKVAKELISAQTAGKIPVAMEAYPIAPMHDNRDSLILA